MIVKMTILRLLGPHLRWFRQGKETMKKSKSKKSRQRYFSITGWTDAKKITYVSALTWSTSGILVSLVEPTLGKLNTSMQWTQKLRQNLYTGWTDDRVLVNVGAVVQRVCFQSSQDNYTHRLNRHNIGWLPVHVTASFWGGQFSITG